MEIVTKLAWVALALIHAPPAAALVSSAAVERLYNVRAEGDLGVILTHRGALFLALVIASVWAAFDPSVRRAVGLVVAISVLGFLAVYARAGMPPGALRTIAIVDGAALLPLAWILFDAWFGRRG